MMDLKSRITGFLAALSVAGCAAVAPPTPAPQGPALWEVSDADTTIYLFGTIHALPTGQQWRTPRLDAAIEEADELVIETVFGDDPKAQAQSMMKLGTDAKDLPPILKRVSADKRPALQKMIGESGVPMAALDKMETWVAVLMLSAGAFKSMGLNAEAGVEHGLTGLYKARSRPISGLETVAEQMGFFDQLSEGAQRDLLESALDDPADAKAQFTAMMNVWSKGDVEGIARTFDAEMKESPELREVLLRKRNARWAEWLDARLDRPGTVLVAVGAGHLAGSDSVQEMLRARGLSARRLQ